MSYTTANALTERAYKHKTHLELSPLLGHYFGLWDSPWKDLKRVLSFLMPSFGLVQLHLGGQMCSPALPAQGNSSCLWFDFTADVCRLQGFGMLGAFVICWLLPSDSLLPRKLTEWWYSRFLLSQRAWLAFWMHSQVQSNLSYMYFSSLHFFISTQHVDSLPVWEPDEILWRLHVQDKHHWLTLGSSVLSPKRISQN